MSKFGGARLFLFDFWGGTCPPGRPCSAAYGQARLVLIRLRCIELVAIYVIEASVPTRILFCVIREDADDLHKRQTFWPSSIHQLQVSHADNNITIMHDNYWVFIDIIRSDCSIIMMGMASFGWKRQVKQMFDVRICLTCVKQIQASIMNAKD